MEDTGKMHVQDLEQIEREKTMKKKDNSDTDSDEEDKLKRGNSRRIKKEIKTFNL